MAAFDVEFGVDPPRASPDRDFCPGFVLQIRNTLPTDVAVRVTTVCGRQRHHNANYAAPAPAIFAVGFWPVQEGEHEQGNSGGEIQWWRW